MENKIITGISQKLFKTFGLDYKIYTENVEQFLNPPCFYIELLQSSMQQIVSRRYRLENLFDIHFFTNENEPKNISVDNDLVRGLGMHYEIVDDVLHFFVSYNLILIKTIEPEEKMETLKTRGEIK